MKASDVIMEKMYISYELMLDFYGMKLEDRITGRLSRTHEFRTRYRNLIRM